MLEVAQCAEPAALELADPALVDFVQGYGVQVMELFTTLPDDGDEVCVLELLQVLRHRLASHVHVPTECRERLAILPMKQVEETSAGRVSERLEDLVEVQCRGASVPIVDLDVVGLGGTLPGLEQGLQAHQENRPLGAAVVHELHWLLPALVERSTSASDVMSLANVRKALRNIGK